MSLTIKKLLLKKEKSLSYYHQKSDLLCEVERENGKENEKSSMKDKVCVGGCRCVRAQCENVRVSVCRFVRLCEPVSVSVSMSVSMSVSVSVSANA